jgi:hypothetical protein
MKEKTEHIRIEVSLTHGNLSVKPDYKTIVELRSY